MTISNTATAMPHVRKLSEGDIMKLPRRQFLQLAAGAAALPTISRVAWAQAYPTRPVHWIVSFAAGGPNDIVARIVGQYLSDHLGQQFIIENRPGAGGNVGMQSVLSSAPDGYTIAFVGPNYAINPTLYEKLPFDFIRDSVPVAGIMRLANVMEVNPALPAKNVAEFIAYAKANPGKDELCFGWRRHVASFIRRAAQSDDRHQSCPRAVPAFVSCERRSNPTDHQPSECAPVPPQAVRLRRFLLLGSPPGGPLPCRAFSLHMFRASGLIWIPVRCT